MITIKSKSEIEKMRIAGKITGDALKLIEKHIKPGVTTYELDKIAFDFIKKQGATPSFLNYNGFPGSICASPNSQVVHGIPSKNVVLKEGDIISIDMGAYIGGYHSDAARTFPVGKISPEAQRLIDVTRESFFEGIKYATHGAKLGDVSAAIQEYVEKNGYSVVRDLVGHGIGKNLHEDPSVPNYGTKGKGVVLLSERQVEALLEKMDIDSFDYYVERLADFILVKQAKVKNHYATILKWWEEDRSV